MPVRVLTGSVRASEFWRLPGTSASLPAVEVGFGLNPSDLPLHSYMVELRRKAWFLLGICLQKSFSDREYIRNNSLEIIYV
jgi:hypothetical protein